MQISKIKVLNEERIGNLISDLERGKLKIPRFQRKFVWEMPKVVNLLDSIYREFPIGSFFLWEADRKYAKYFKDIGELELPKPEKFSLLDFILDGQQRITSLYAVMKGKKIGNVNYGRICFDLQNGCFAIKRKSNFKLGDSKIPFFLFFGDEHLSIYDSVDAEKKKVFNKCISTFNNYPLSIVKVTEKELQDAITIFERINQGGKRLSIFDLVVAGTWGEDFDLREKFEELEKYLGNKGFGKIEPEVLLHAISLAVKGYCRQQYLLQLTKNEIKDIWPEIEDSFKLAIDYLSFNLGVKIYDFTPYPAMISLLSYLFYKIKNRAISGKNSEYVHQWFWQSALGERYSRSRETKMEEDKKKIFDRLIDEEDVNIKFPIDLSVERLEEMKIKTKSAIRNAFFCMLALKHPKHFKNGNNIILDHNFCSQYNHKELHHIFPKAFLKKNNINSRDILLNFCFIPAELNKEILKTSPSKYFKEYDKENPDFADTLKSHLIPMGDFIEDDEYERFIDVRAKLVLNEFENLCSSKISRVVNNNRNRAVDGIESRMRDDIDSVLLKKEGYDYWNKCVPSDILETVNKKVSGYLSKNPNTSITSFNGRKLLDFCDVMDYYKIIMANWLVFEKIFRSKAELERKFLKFKDYRNITKHDREMDSILRKEGEAAIEWFDKVLK